ncbi:MULTISPECIES: hypothetical protein [unclassified Streptomyces]|uniref:hypothetical protein n=1 Tax=unclassified Streptomyces TaxID=2593676 RepID=UPI00224E813E|nr:hypothetical protein [Streptomyces sp. NBC_01551]MCX4527530.1 hypothetical protein [Streptomyces sp. NBC_01551]
MADLLPLPPAAAALGLELPDPEPEGVIEPLEEVLRAPSEAHDPLDLFSRADPAEVKLVGDAVKVRGRMRVEASAECPGQVHVRTDYSFVYPFVQAKPGAEQVERTVDDTQEDCRVISRS